MKIHKLVVNLLWALGVEGQGDVAEVSDVTGRGFSGDGLAFAAMVIRLQDEALLLGMDLLSSGWPDYGPVFVQLVL